MSKFLDENGLSFLWTKIKTLISGAVSSAESKLSNYLPLTGGTMTGNLQTPKVTVTDKTSDDILLGDGSTTSLASIKGAYLPLSGGYMNKGAAVYFGVVSTTGTSYCTFISKNMLKLDYCENGHEAKSTQITPEGIRSPKFTLVNGSSDKILLADGTTTSLSAIKGAYLPLTGGEINGKIRMLNGGTIYSNIDRIEDDSAVKWHTQYTFNIDEGLHFMHFLTDTLAEESEGQMTYKGIGFTKDDGGLFASLYSSTGLSVGNAKYKSTLDKEGLSTYTVNTHTIKGRALPGTENEDLILGSYNGTFMSTGQFTDIGDYSGIIIGGQMNDNDTTDNPSHRGLAVVSPHYVAVASKDDIELRASALIESMSDGSIAQTAKYYIHNKAGSGYDLTVAGHTNIKAQPSELKIMSPASGGQIHIQTNDLRLGKYVSESTADSSYIEANTIADGAVVEINDNGYGAMIQTCSNKYVKFRVDGDTTMRLNAANDTNPGGLRVFTNIFANTDHVTDMPSYITSNTKTTLNTKSLQSLIAPLIQNTFYYSDGTIERGGTTPGIMLTPNDGSGQAVGVFKAYVDNNGYERVVIGVDESNVLACNPQLYISVPGEGEYRFNTDKAIELGLLVKD